MPARIPALTLGAMERERAMAAEIRRAGPDDAVAIAHLGRATFEETFGSLFREHADDLRAYLDATFGIAKIAESLRRPGNGYWLASMGGSPAGYAKLKHPSAPPGKPDQEAAQLQKIYVLRDFLGAGLGRGLLAPLMAEAAARSSLVWLDVLRDNERAIRFYARHGFAEIGADSYTIGAQTFPFTVMARPTR